MAAMLAFILFTDEAGAQTSFPARPLYYVFGASSWFSYSPYEPTGGLYSDPDSAFEPLFNYSAGLEGRVYSFLSEHVSSYGGKLVSYNLHLTNSTFPEGVNITAQATISVTFSCPVGFLLSSTQCVDPVTRRSECPAGTIFDSINGCIAPPPAPPACQKNAQGSCNEPNKEPDPCASTPMPIHMGTGNKYLTEIDYQSGYKNGLSYIRHYNSQSAAQSGSMGVGWRHNFDHFLQPDTIGGVPAMVMNRANGSAYTFISSAGAYVRESGFVNDTLLQLKDNNGMPIGWQYGVASDGSTEQYNLSGQLVSIRHREGTSLALSYTAGSDSASPGKLFLLTNNFGATMRLRYDAAGRVSAVRVSGAREFFYTYDVDNNLTSVTYPDKKIKQYRYNEAANTGGISLPHAMTGIVDENNSRMASYFFDAQGRATAEHLGSGVNRHTLTYNPDGSTVMIDPLNTARMVQFSSHFGRLKNSGQSQPGGAGCSAASNIIIRDANGNATAITDFKGVTTTYTHDLTRNLETSRTEAAGTPQARKISTQWHPGFRIPRQIDEPLRRTIYTHDASGNVLSMSEQATLDATGNAGAAAAVTGSVRKTSYTYNALGQLTSRIGPRLDVNDITTFAYLDASLYSVTNAAGHVTTMGSFDADGRAGVMTDPNGTVTTLSYHPRGWVLASTVTADGVTAITNYTYDAAGQLLQVSLPDNSQINYTWDAAHRLTKVTDHVGNSINYTLDNMGNRTKETILDASGNLTRQVNRVFDALNRLQEITGARQ